MVIIVTEWLICSNGIHLFTILIKNLTYTKQITDRGKPLKCDNHPAVIIIEIISGPGSYS